MSGFAVLVYKAHPRLLIFPAVQKSAPYTRDYTVHKASQIMLNTDFCDSGNCNELRLKSMTFLVPKANICIVVNMMIAVFGT